MAPPGRKSSSPEVETDIKHEIKEDPDSIPIITSVNIIQKPRSSKNTPKVKKEEAGDKIIDLTLPDAPAPPAANSDFDPFDGSDDDSALSDLDGFDEEYVDDSEGVMETRNGVQYFVCRTFEIPQISAPVVLMRYVSDLFACLEYGSIILDPDYQREIVWDEHRASMLICSILMGYFVPPIIFNHKMIRRQTPDGEVSVIMNQRICVDGKQRLTALQKFMSGQIGILDKNQRKWYFCHPMVNGQETHSNHIIMPTAVKDFFKKRTLCCYEYNELPQETEENMFQLVQRGIALTPAEKMRAKSTEWAAFAKQFEEDYSIVVNLSKQNRASGFRIVLTIFAMILETMGQQRKSKHSNRTAPTLQASPQALERLLEDKIPINTPLKLKFKEIFDRFETLVKACSDQLTATKYRIKENSVFDPAPDFLDEKTTRTFSPVELVGTAVLVSYHMATRTDAQLLKAVKELRRHLRIHFKDLRLNAQCWSSVWEFIRDLPKDLAASPEPRRLARDILQDWVEDDEDEEEDEPWTPTPYLEATTQVGDIVGDLDKRTTRSQAIRSGVKRQPKRVRKRSMKSYKALSRESSATADDSDAGQSEEEESLVSFSNLQMPRNNTMPVVEIPRFVLSKPSIDIEMVDADLTNSSEAEYKSSTSDVEAIGPTTVLNEESPRAKELSTDTDIKELEVVGSMIASGSPEKPIIDAQPQILNVFQDLIADPQEQYMGTAGMGIHAGEGSSHNFSTGVYLLGLPDETEGISQSTCQTIDGEANLSIDKLACRATKASPTQQEEYSRSSIDNDNPEPVGALNSPALSAGKFKLSGQVTTEGEDEINRISSLKALSSDPEITILEISLSENQRELADEPKNDGRKDSLAEVPSRSWKAVVPDSTFRQNPNKYAAEYRSKTDLQIMSHSSNPEASTQQSTKLVIPPPNHFQKVATNTKAIAMADILKLAEDKPKIKSRFKPKAPIRVTERRPEASSSDPFSTQLGSRPNMTSAAESPRVPSYLPKRSPSSPVGGESSMKKLRPEEDTSPQIQK